jgi:plasmid rolling circle replication initiator protein Rep
MNYNIKKDKKTNLTKEQNFLQKPTDKKVKNILLSKIHKLNDNPSKSSRAFNCGNYLEFTVSCENERKLTNANFCKSRLCPMCNWRLSQKRFSNLSNVIEQLYQQGKYQLLFLTLTVKNCDGKDLRQEIKKMLSAWSYISHKNPIFNTSIHGWFRALEVTYNQKLNNYHPHLHVVLAVKPYYFDGKYYITQQKWVDMWQSALKIDYEPIVHICKEYKNKNRQSESTLISEASKYATKDTDYIIPNDMKLSANIVEVLDSAMRSVRLIAYGGILKTIHEKLKLDDSNYEDKITDKDLNSTIEYYKWYIGYGKYQLFNPYNKFESINSV